MNQLADLPVVTFPRAWTQWHCAAIVAALEPLKEAEQAATELRAVVPREGLFFGLVGLEMEPETVALVDGHIVIRRVTNPPGIIHVFGPASQRGYVPG